MGGITYLLNKMQIYYAAKGPKLGAIEFAGDRFDVGHIMGAFINIFCSFRHIRYYRKFNVSMEIQQYSISELLYTIENDTQLCGNIRNVLVMLRLRQLSRNFDLVNHTLLN